VPLHFDLRDLELFVAVAEAGSIARAAERSHTVASAVSKRLSDLEETFGAALLVRSARGVELTPAGHALLNAAQNMLHQAQQLEHELRQYASGARGHVRVFANISAIVEFLPQALASFLQRYADIHVHLEEHVSDEIARAVAENLADIGILSDMPAIDGLATLPFRNDELVIVAPRNHALAAHRCVSFVDALDHPLVCLHADSSLQRLLLRAATDANRRFTPRIQVTGFDAVCAMVAAGLGVGIVPRAATSPYIASLGLATIELQDEWAKRQLFLCTRAHEPLHRAAQMLLDHLRTPPV
jgi:DNA-binding transcriptional LysR family regulator